MLHMNLIKTSFWYMQAYIYVIPLIVQIVLIMLFKNIQLAYCKAILRVF